MSVATLDDRQTDARTHPAIDTGLLVLRLALGLIFMAHGAQKLFGAFGGPGLAGVVHMMGPIGYLVAIGEFFGGLGIIVGFLTRFSAASISVIMLGAMGMVHLKNGFFLTPKIEGFEYDFALFGMALALAIIGPGRLAVQNALPGLLRKL